MAKSKEPANPFYVLLVLLGILFLVTACAYGTMAYRAVVGGKTAVESHPLMALLDRSGIEIMGVELGFLAAATFGAMWLDQRRMRINAPSAKTPESGAEPPSSGE